MKMDCQEFREDASARLDGEISERDLALLANHLAACPACAAHAAAVEEARATVGLLPGPVEPPAALRAAVEAIALAAAPRSSGRRFLLAAAGAAACVALAASPLWLIRQAERDLAGTLIGDHVSFLPPAEAVEVLSSDPPQVERWFTSRLGFAVRAVALPGARLTGGRICHIAGCRAALLFYECEGKRVSLFVIPDTPRPVWVAPPGPAMSAASGGFHLSGRKKGDLRYVLVAAIAPDRLESMLDSGLTRL